MAELRIPLIAEFKGKKAFKDADRSIKNLSGSFKKLAGAAGIGLSTAAVISFGKAAVKAFAEDEKAANRLAMSVKNLGLGFETPRIEKYIEELSRATGVTDDQLRPAMQKLLQTTGSVTKAQQLLTQAVDVSAGSGIDYETVVNDLSLAYVGQTKGLSKYSLGLTKAELKTMSFAQIQEKLNSQFSGANAAYLTTYAGKMQLLSTAAGEASETIGGALINALTDLFGAKDVTELIGKIDTLALKTSNMIDDLAWKWKKFWFATSDRAILEGFNPFSTYVEDGLKAIDISHKVAMASRNAVTQGYLGSQPVGIYETAAQKAARVKAEKDAQKRAKELAAMQAKQLADTKKKLALENAAKTLDLQRINITAALKGQISETDKLSLQLQMALLDKNDQLATTLAAKLEAAVKANMELQKNLLATPEAPNPYRNWMPPKFDYNEPLPKGFTPPKYPEPSPNPQGPKKYVPPTVSDFPSDSFKQYGPQGGLGAGVIAGVNPTINVNVQVGAEDVAAIVTQTQTNDSLSGSFNQVNRGGFKGAVAI